MPPTDNVLVSVAFGAGLLVMAGGLALRLPQEPLEPLQTDRPGRSRLLRGRRRRRASIAVLLALLGGLIPAGDIWLTAHRDPRWFAVYVLAVLGLSLWLLWLGVLEALASLARITRDDQRGSLDRRDRE